MRARCFLLYVCICLGWPSVVAAGQQGTSVRIWSREDASDMSVVQLSRDDARRDKKSGWKRVKGDIFVPGAMGRTYWLKIEIVVPGVSSVPRSYSRRDGHGATPRVQYKWKRWALGLRHFDLKWMQVFFPARIDGRAGWLHEYVPTYRSHALRRRLVYPLDTKHAMLGRVVVYVRLRTYTKLAWRGAVKVSLRQWDQWARVDQGRLLFQGLYYGILCSLVILHLFLFFWLRDAAALWFVVYNATLIVYVLLGSGLLHGVMDALSVSPLTLFRTFEFVLGMYIFGAIYYTRIFLGTAEHTPRLDRMLWVYLGFVFVYLVLTPWASPWLIGTFSQWLGLLSPVVTILPGWVFWRRGFRPALIYLWAWGVFSIAAFIYASPFWDFHGFLIFQVGSALSAVMLSLAMVQRIRLLREGQALANEQLQRSEHMATLGQLVAGVTHEINNPNNFIIFNLPLLRQYIDGIEPHLRGIQESDPSVSILRMTIDEFLDDTHQLIDTMEHGAQRIDGIVRDLREYVGGHRAATQRVAALAPTLERAVALVGKQVRQQVAVLTVDINDDLPLVSQHVGKIEQVLINVLLNAAQAVAGRSHARVAFLAQRDEERPGWVSLIVEDNGPGIPDSLKHQIFAPFFTTKGRESSMGLGLFISQRIVEEHGGLITVGQSREGGARIAISLPSVEASGQEDAT